MHCLPMSHKKDARLIMAFHRWADGGQRLHNGSARVYEVKEILWPLILILHDFCCLQNFFRN